MSQPMPQRVSSTASGINNAVVSRKQQDTRASVPDVASWDQQAVLDWIRGVEKLNKKELEALRDHDIDGAKLTKLTLADLEEIGIKRLGQRLAIVLGIQALRGLKTQLTTSPISVLGTELLDAGKSLETHTLLAVSSMLNSLTKAIKRMDNETHVQAAKYGQLRSQLVNKATSFIQVVNDTEDTTANNHGFVKQAKTFVREILPILQQLRSLKDESSRTAKQEGPDLHDIRIRRFDVSVPLGLSIRSSSNGVIYISDIADGGTAEKSGMLRLNDEIIEVNGQVVLGWRTRAVANLLRESGSTIVLTLRISVQEYDARVQHILEQARAMRQSMTPSSRCSSISQRERAFSRGRGSGTGSHSSRKTSSEPESISSIDKVQILAPLPLESWTAGMTHQIQWQSPAEDSERSVAIRLIHTEKNVNLLVAECAPNTGSFSWQVPRSLDAMSGYQILVTVLPDDSDPRETRVLSGKFSLAHRRSTGNLFDEHSGSDSRRNSKAMKSYRVLAKRMSSGQFGFNTDGLFISNVLPDTDVTDALHTGHQILRIDGRVLSEDMSHIAIRNTIEDAGEQVELIVADNLEGYKSYLELSSHLYGKYGNSFKTQEVELASCPSDVSAYGLALAGRAGIVSVAQTMPGSPAAKCQNLEMNTCIVEVNHEPVAGASPAEVYQMLDRRKNKMASLVVTKETSSYQNFSQKILEARLEASFSQEMVGWLLRRISRPSILSALRRSSSNSLSNRSRTSSRSSANQAASNYFDDAPPANAKTPCQSIVDPDLAGWLVKLGGSGLTPKNWRRRWFVLKKGVVFYYKTPNDMEALGVFKLEGSMVMPPEPKKHMYNKHGFKIYRGKQRPYYLCADTAEEMKDWQNAMSLASIRFEGQPSSPGSRRGSGDRLDALHQNHSPGQSRLGQVMQQSSSGRGSPSNTPGRADYDHSMNSTLTPGGLSDAIERSHSRSSSTHSRLERMRKTNTSSMC